MKNKNILITGGSSGIGFEIARIFCQNNAKKIFLLARNKSKLDEATLILKSLPSQTEIIPIVVDFMVQQNIDNCLKKCLEYGVPDILINNVGVFQQNKLEDQNLNELMDMIQVNVVAAYQITQFFLPFLKNLPTAQIYNICSIGSLIGLKNCSAYNLTKFALYGFGKSLRTELLNSHIKVTNILPGATLTPVWNTDFDNPERLIDPKEIAQTVYFCSQMGLTAVVEDIIIRPQHGDL